MYRTCLLSLGSRVLLLSTIVFAPPFSAMVLAASPDEPHLVADIATDVKRGGLPGNFAPFYDGIIYRSADGPSGLELWKNYGTYGTSSRIADLRIGPAWSVDPLGYLWGPSFSEIVQLDPNTWIFSADDGSTGMELYRTDGTEEGTVFLADIYPGLDSSYPREFAVLNGVAYFEADTPDHGAELWRTDGTSTGTYLLADILVGAGGSDPKDLTVFKDHVYFSATGAFGRELYRTDGTAAGTELVADIEPGPSGSYPSDLTVAYDQTISRDILYFSAYDDANGRELWKSLGLPANTWLAADVEPGPASSSPAELVRYEDMLVFTADTSGAGREPWRSRGSQFSTFMIQDINPGPADSEPRHLTEAGVRIYFSADDGVNGRELWMTDGTSALLMGDINPGPASSSPQELVDLNFRVFFFADDGTHGRELWRQNGWDPPELVGDLYPGSASAVSDTDSGDYSGWSGYLMRSIGGKLYFRADDGTLGTELWSSDGINLIPMTNSFDDISSYPNSLIPLGDAVIFDATDAAHGHELWRSEGTEATTSLLADIQPGPASGIDETFEFDIAILGNSMFFGADDGVHGEELWITDGTSGGTRMVKDIFPGPDPSWPKEAVAFGDVIVFSATSPDYGWELWKSDGTEAGTQIIADLEPGTGTGAAAGAGVAEFGYVFFKGNTSTYGGEPWKTDGTAAGTTLLRDIVPGPDSSINLVTPPFASNGRYVFFPADDRIHGRELWRTDGTTEGTVMVADIRPGEEGSFRFGLTAVGDKVYFLADDGRTGQELWVSDGTSAGTHQVIDLFPGVGSGTTYGFSQIFGLSFWAHQAVGNELYFAGADGTSGLEAWATDGTEAGTRLLRDIMRGPKASSPDGFQRTVASPQRTLFFAGDHLTGFELWETAGTEASTQQVGEINPGPESGGFGRIAVAGQWAYFAGYQPDTGRELWAICREGDGDADGYSLCAGDCETTNPTIYPSAAQVCDGANNDCNDPSWPAAPADETDDDADGFVECAPWQGGGGVTGGGDCDDTDAATYPGAIETNDGKDNQCPGDPGYGSVDEISGEAGFNDPANKNLLSWPAQPGATLYEVAVSSRPDFSADCESTTTPTNSWTDPQGQGAGIGRDFLVRPLRPFVGSWGQDSSGAERNVNCNCPTWSKTLGGASDETLRDVVRVSNGDFFVVGSTASFEGPQDLLVERIAPDGQLVWAVAYGGPGAEEGDGIAATADGGAVVVGSTTSVGFGKTDLWVLKIARDGSVEWQRNLGGPGYDYGRDVVVLSPDELVVVGDTESFGAGRDDVWVLDFDSTGQLMWSRTYGGRANDVAHSVTTAEGGVLVAADTESFGAGAGDAWLLSLNSNDGSVFWQQTYGGGGSESAQEVVSTRAPGFVVAGRTTSFGHGAEDVWVFKVDTAGRVLWESAFGDTGNDSARGLTESADGGLLVSGQIAAPAATIPDGWVIKLTGAGELLWQQRFEGAGTDVAWSTVETGIGALLVSIESDSYGRSGLEHWISRANADGQVDESCAISPTFVERMPTSTEVGVTTIQAHPTNPEPVPTNLHYGRVTLSSRPICSAPGCSAP